MEIEHELKASALDPEDEVSLKSHLDAILSFRKVGDYATVRILAEAVFAIELQEAASKISPERKNELKTKAQAEATKFLAKHKAELEALSPEDRSAAEKSQLAETEHKFLIKEAISKHLSPLPFFGTETKAEIWAVYQNCIDPEEKSVRLSDQTTDSIKKYVVPPLAAFTASYLATLTATVGIPAAIAAAAGEARVAASITGLARLGLGMLGRASTAYRIAAPIAASTLAGTTAYYAANGESLWDRDADEITKTLAFSVVAAGILTGTQAFTDKILARLLSPSAALNQRLLIPEITGASTTALANSVLPFSVRTAVQSASFGAQALTLATLTHVLNKDSDASFLQALGGTIVSFGSFKLLHCALKPILPDLSQITPIYKNTIDIDGQKITVHTSPLRTPTGGITAGILSQGDFQRVVGWALRQNGMSPVDAAREAANFTTLGYTPGSNPIVDAALKPLAANSHIVLVPAPSGYSTLADSRPLVTGANFSAIPASTPRGLLPQTSEIPEFRTLLPALGEQATNVLLGKLNRGASYGEALIAAMAATGDTIGPSAQPSGRVAINPELAPLIVLPKAPVPSGHTFVSGETTAAGNIPGGKTRDQVSAAASDGANRTPTTGSNWWEALDSEKIATQLRADIAERGGRDLEVWERTLFGKRAIEQRIDGGPRDSGMLRGLQHQLTYSPLEDSRAEVLARVVAFELSQYPQRNDNDQFEPSAVLAAAATASLRPDHLGQSLRPIIERIPLADIESALSSHPGGRRNGGTVERLAIQRGDPEAETILANLRSEFRAGNIPRFLDRHASDLVDYCATWFLKNEPAELDRIVDSYLAALNQAVDSGKGSIGNQPLGYLRGLVSQAQVLAGAVEHRQLELRVGRFAESISGLSATSQYASWLGRLSANDPSTHLASISRPLDIELFDVPLSDGTTRSYSVNGLALAVDRLVTDLSHAGLDDEAIALKQRWEGTWQPKFLSDLAHYYVANSSDIAQALHACARAAAPDEPTRQVEILRQELRSIENALGFSPVSPVLRSTPTTFFSRFEQGLRLVHGRLAAIFGELAHDSPTSGILNATSLAQHVEIRREASNMARDYLLRFEPEGEGPQVSGSADTPISLPELELHFRRFSNVTAENAGDLRASLPWLAAREVLSSQDFGFDREHGQIIPPRPKPKDYQVSTVDGELSSFGTHVQEAASRALAREHDGALLDAATIEGASRFARRSIADTPIQERARVLAKGCLANARLLHFELSGRQPNRTDTVATGFQALRVSETLRYFGRRGRSLGISDDLIHALRAQSDAMDDDARRLLSDNFGLTTRTIGNVASHFRTILNNGQFLQIHRFEGLEGSEIGTGERYQLPSSPLAGPAAALTRTPQWSSRALLSGDLSVNALERLIAEHELLPVNGPLPFRPGDPQSALEEGFGIEEQSHLIYAINKLQRMRTDRIERIGKLWEAVLGGRNLEVVEPREFEQGLQQFVGVYAEALRKFRVSPSVRETDSAGVESSIDVVADYVARWDAHVAEVGSAGNSDFMRRYVESLSGERREIFERHVRDWISSHGSGVGGN